MKKVLLAILDGVGYRENEHGNAVRQADMKFFNKLLDMYPHCLLKASGEEVGLPEGQMGNSEVGHLTIGSGRVVYQSLSKINKAIEDKSFYNNEELLKTIDHVKNRNSKLHICGLLSDGGVHSHIDHILALLDMAKQNKVRRVYLHLFLDGRDTNPRCALKYLNQLDEYINKIGLGAIATISGRYYAMDREEFWDRTYKSYEAMVNNHGNHEESYEKLIDKSYENNISDEFILPTILDDNGMIEENDGVIIANFRPDRLMQLVKVLIDKSFKIFRTKKFDNLKLLTMFPVSSNFNIASAFYHDICNNTLLEVLNDNKYRILQIAEVSKFPHVTHFFQGDKDINLDYATKMQVLGKNVATYDLAPQMSSNDLTDKIVEIMPNYDFIVVNYANGDMVGHTGNLQACVEGLKVVDSCLERLYFESLANDFTLIVTADHGNCEYMLTDDDKMLTTHTTSPVYFIVCDNTYDVSNGALADIAPSILEMMGISVPSEMSNKRIISDPDII